jgi:hypothetical protein
MDGRAAFASDAVAFIQSLPDHGKLSIRTTRSNDGKIKEASFNLGAVSEVRNKIAKACDWRGGPVDEPVGSIEAPRKTLISIYAQASSDCPYVQSALADFGVAITLL